MRYRILTSVGDFGAATLEIAFMIAAAFDLRVVILDAQYLHDDSGIARARAGA